MVSIDFLRGISIYVNLICHTAGSVTSMTLIEKFAELKGFDKFIMIVFMIGFMLFSGFRSVFIYVSGFAFGLTYV